MSLEFTIGQVAEAVGVSGQAIRYYECLRLLKPTSRRSSGYRLYGDDEVHQLRFIKNAQALGFTLHEVGELLTLTHCSLTRRSDVQQKARAKLEEVGSKARALQALARSLRALIRECESSQLKEGCPIVDSLEQQRRNKHDNRQTTRRGVYRRMPTL